MHPEAYPVVRRILAGTETTAGQLIGATATLRGLNARAISPTTGSACPPSPTSCASWNKPGRDPRPAFATATFAEGIEKIADLQPGLVLEGVVTNVAAFGAFVDIGVHQDGLVHVSAMSRSFVSDPRSVVKSGDVVRVKVLSVDVPRHRISLTLRLDDEATPQARESAPPSQAGPGPRPAGPRARAGGRSAQKQEFRPNGQWFRRRARRCAPPGRAGPR